MSTVFGIFAHVDAGKTTLSEQILYKCGLTRKIGKVDDKNSILDNNEIERKRGITIFADEAKFTLDSNEFYLIDTPGHMDFAGEMERSILAIDVAILVISAVEGVQGTTQSIWKLLNKNHIPTIFFINKTDRDIANPQQVINYIREKWVSNLAVFDESFKNCVIDENLAEQIASTNDTLMEDYFNGIKIDKSLKKSLQNCDEYCAVCGSAAKDINIDILLNVLKTFYTSDKTQISELRAIAYKIRHDKNGSKITHFKIISGNLKPKMQVCHIYNNEKAYATVNEISKTIGNKYIHCDNAQQGELCAVSGLDNVKIGDIIGDNPCENNLMTIKPLMKVKISSNDCDNSSLYKILKQYEEEEPLLNVEYNKSINEIHIQIMGTVQLEIIKNLFLQNNNTNIDFGECEILYKETIKNKVMGCGHYEPLRHYAEVHLMLEPIDDDKIIFESMCSTDELGTNWQRLVKTHVFEKQHLGVLTGSPLTGVKITLISGRAHIKHTEGGDFREATYRAIRQGLMKAESVLLEPWFKFEIIVSNELSGRVFTDITKMGGEYSPPENYNDEVLISGICPVKTMQNYSCEFISFTGGKGSIATEFYAYKQCCEQDNVVKQKSYNPESDLANSPHSVFCSHGAGFTVNWNETDSYMHIKD